jgi:hypothetical protein
MLIKAKTLKGYKLKSIDGEIGSVKEFYFDDNYWTIRYLIAETGNWLFSRQVLISPHALIDVNKEDKYISVNLTNKQIEESPPLESDLPVSRQYEESYHGYYGYPLYWAGAYMWGPYPYIERDYENLIEQVENDKTWDSHLRSTFDVTDYSIQATDGEIGHIDDFIIDDELWVIRYLIIDTKKLWKGNKVLISPKWISQISWIDGEVKVNLSQEAIKKSPEYSDQALITRDFEKVMHKHYNIRGYWDIEEHDNDEER